MLDRFVAALRGLLTRRRAERELADELQFHIEKETEANIARGMSPIEARRRALCGFGGVQQTRESVRDQRATWMDRCAFYLRHAIRGLGRSPAYSIAVTLVLALGIAGSTVVYSIAEALLFRPIPYADPGSLCVVSWAFSTGGIQAEVVSTVPHWELFERLRTRQTSLESVAAYSSRGANIRGDGWSERLQVGSVTREFLPLTGARPFPGRGFLEAEFQAGTSHVALLTHSVWQRRFAGAADAVGRTVVVDDTPYTVVGVLPPDFRSFDELQTGLPTWFDNSLGVLVPLRGDPTLSSRSGSSATSTLRVLGRLRQGRMLEAVRKELAVLSAGLRWPPGPMSPTYTLTPLAAALTPGVPQRLALLAAAVAVLLLVACANGALLMVQRREGRRREMEIRAALGATPRQLASEAIVEALLLGVSACGVGLAIAWTVIRVTRANGGAALTGLAAVQVGWAVVGFSVAASLGAALGAGLAPCVELLRNDAASWWPASWAPHPSSRPGSLPTSIVVSQVGLSVGLIVVGAMLARDFSRLAAVDIGYEADGVLMGQVALSPGRHPDRGRQFFDHFLDRLREQPSVEGAALIFPAPGMPMAGATSGRVEGYGDEAIPYRVVSPSYFSLLRIPILVGREFTDADARRAEPVVLVNSTFAERYWGSAKAAIGRQIFMGWNPKGTPGPPVTIIGVMRDVASPWGGRAVHEMYVTYAKAAQWGHLQEMALLVRAADGDLARLRVRLAQSVREIDPYQPLFNVRVLADVVKASLARTRLLLTLVAAFSALATLLAAVGVYVVLAFAVTRRTREFGIRLALGAPRQGVLLQVLGGTLRLVAKGVALTVPLTYGAVWLLAAQLFGVTDTDPMTCVWAIGIIAAAALVASLAPAWRATRVDPIVALRQE
jgi:putative ABC transport system permease protein